MPAKVAQPPASAAATRPLRRAVKSSTSSSASAATPSSRAPSSSSRVSRPATTTTSATSAAASVKSTPVASSSRQPPMDQQTLVASFKSVETTTSRAVADLLRHLETTPTRLRIQLLEPVNVVPSQSSASEPSQPSRETVQLAKEVVNASFSAIGQLCAAKGDKASSAPSSPSKNLLHLVDAFRIALRVVFAAKSSRAASTSNRWQTHQVALTHLKRAVAVGVIGGLRQEVAYLRSQILQQEASSDQLPGDAELLRYDVPTDLDQTQCSLVLDLQSLLLNQLAEGQEAVTPKRLHSILDAIADKERGVAAWKQAASDAPAAQRLPFAVERCLSKLSSALPNSDDAAATVILEARKQGVLWLLHANLDGGDEATTAARRAQVVARIERMAISHWKEANARGSKQVAWKEVNAALEEIEASAEETWKALKEWTKLVETWRWLAVKNGDVVAASRLAGTPATSNAPSSSKSQDVGAIFEKAISCCSHAVSSLDVLRADTSATVTSVAPSLQSATQALVNLVAAGDAARGITDGNRQALLKLLDRLRRRCCAGIEAWLRQGDDAVAARRLFSSALEAESQQIVASVRGGGKQEEIAAGATGNASGFRTLGLSLYDAGEEEETLTWLSRGVEALKSLISEDGEQRSFSSIAAEQLSLLDAALYHVGGRIYTARRYALAVRFIEAAAKAGEEAQRLAPAGAATNDDASRAHSLFKKWDYASACHRLLSRPKEALVALRHSLASLPPRQWQQLEELAASKTVEGVFESEECSALARSLRALFEVSVFELLAKPGDAAEDGDDVAAVLSSSGASPLAQAVCIEYLASSTWIQSKMHTEGAEEAVAGLLQTLSELVDAEGTPIRRARALLHRFERAALGAGPLQDLELDDEIMSLLASTQLDQDSELAKQLPILRCRHRLLAVLAPARKEDTSVKNVEEVAKAAIESVRGLFEAQGSQPEKRVSTAGTGRTPPLRSTSAPKQATTRAATQPRAQPTARTVSKATATRTRAVSKPAVAATTTRPRAGQKAVPAAATAAPVTPPRKAAPGRKQPIEGSAGVIDLLQLTCDYLSAFGQTLLSIELLQHLRRLTSGTKEQDETWSRATIALAKQNIALGRVSRAEGLVASLGNVSRESRCLATFVHAQLLHGDEATRRYSEALELAATLEEESDGASRAGLGKVLSKVARYRRISAAAEAFSCIAADHGDSTRAIEGAFHATQYSIRAASLLARVTTYQNESTSQAEDVATLSSPTKKDPALAAAEAQEAGTTTASKTSLGGGSTSARPHRLLSIKIASTHWQVQRDLLSCFQRLAYLYQLRGSARDAEMFAGEAVDLATGLGLHLSTSQSLLIRAEVRLQLGKRAEGEEDVAKALRLLSDVWLPEAATLACIQGDQLAKSAETREDALRAYQTGQETVRALRRAYTEVEQAVPSPRGLPTSSSTRSSLGGKTPRGSSIGGAAFAEGLLAEMHCRLLRRQAWLLQVLGRQEESEAMMVQADAMQPSSDDLLACGRLLLDRALRGMSSDPIWGMVSDAVVALPSSKALAAVKNSRGRTPAKAVLQALAKAESAFAAVTDDASRGCAVSIRRAYKGLALSTMLHRTFLHQATALDDMLDMLDSAAAVTLQREAQHAVWSKLEVASSKETWLHWDKSQADKTPKPSVKAIKLPSSSRAHSPSSEEDDEQEEEAEDTSAWRSFWREKKEGATSDAVLPANWTVISIGLSRQRNSLVISRRSASSTPMILSLPFDRRRDEAEDEADDEEAEASAFDLDAAQRELKDIVSSSNALTFAARNVSVSEDMEQRKAWWTSRRELDTRMKTLCAAIEERWLGAFKSVWADAVGDAESAAMEGLRANLDAIVQRMCFPHQATKQRAAVKVELDDAVYDLVARVVPSSTSDEELEDLLHFIMDIHQLNGVPVAVDEADFDMLAYDLRAAIEEYRSASAREGRQASPTGNRHLFLVLDKDTAAIPWESLPSLRGRAICRIPSMSFLTDRVSMARRLGASQDNDGAFHLPRSCQAYYLLNPSTDLVKSQERFEPFLRAKSSLSSWRGIIGRAPAPNDFAHALETYPLVLYFGHSGAEQYVRATRLRAMQKCAVTMLWGCSSAVLRDQGDFDRTGTPYNYMMAGSPCVVGQLFDATDKELDSVSEAVLIKCGLKDEEEDKKETRAEEETKTMSLAQAVAQSRDSCRLPYLTGAAPVVYGVPVYFDR